MIVGSTLMPSVGTPRLSAAIGLLSFLLLGSCSGRHREQAAAGASSLAPAPASASVPASGAPAAPTPPAAPEPSAGAPVSPEEDGAELAEPARELFRTAACGEDGDVPARFDAKLVASHCASLKSLYDRYRKRWLDVAM